MLGFPRNLLVSVNLPLCCFRGSPFPAPLALAGAGSEQGEGFGEWFELLRQELTAASQGSLQVVQ